jgi:predicted nucleic acid-binding protein
MTERVLVDTGAIYAFVVRGDANHVHARRFVKSWLARKWMRPLESALASKKLTKRGEKRATTYFAG